MGQQPPGHMDAPPQFVPPSRKTPEPPKDGGWFDYQAILRNRLILGGLGVLVIMLLVAIVLFAIDSGSSNGPSSASAGPTDPAATAIIGPGLRGRMLATVGSYAGPGTTFPFLGLVRSGTVLTVVGRNEGEAWFQVIYPPGTTFRVWVAASAIEIEGDTSELVIAGPAEAPNIVVPTFAGPIFVPTEPGGTIIENTPTPVVVEPTSRPTFTPQPTWTPAPTRTAPPPIFPTPANKGRPTP